MSEPNPAAPAVQAPAAGGDLVAGLCVAGLLLPEAVAYAGLARLPVVHALTAMLVGLLIYALAGGSRFAIVSPTSSSATLAAAAVLSIQNVAGGGQVDYTSTLMALVLMAGAVLVLLALLRQGQLSAYVSRPVLRGFAFALAVTIVIKQLPDAIGLTPPTGLRADPFDLLGHIIAHPSEWHWPSLLVALAAAALVIGLRRWPRVPASMVAIVLAILAARLLDLHQLGVAQLGAVARPSWQPALPHLDQAHWLQVAELAFGLVVLIFAESWGSMRSLALLHGNRLDANRELLVLGSCNLAAAVLQGMPVAAGFSASVANHSAGAVSRRAGMVALAVIALVVALALPALQWLPRPVLAVAVISALWHALNPRPLLDIWRMGRDRGLVLGAVAAVLAFGVLHGMLIAVGLSLLAALRRFSLPVVHELGELGDSRDFVELEGHAGAAAVPGLLVLRPEAPLFFASAEGAVNEVINRVNSRTDLSTVVLSLEESADLDSTAVECLMELDQRLRRRSIDLVLSRAKEPVRALLSHCDPHGVGDPARLFWSVADAVQARRAAPASALASAPASFDR